MPRQHLAGVGGAEHTVGHQGTARYDRVTRGYRTAAQQCLHRVGQGSGEGDSRGVRTAGHRPDHQIAGAARRQAADVVPAQAGGAAQGRQLQRLARLHRPRPAAQPGQQQGAAGLQPE